MRKETIIQILDTLHAEYSKKLSDKEKGYKVRTWMAVLGDITNEQGRIGLTKALKSTSEFMIPVGQFRVLCLTPECCNSSEDEASDAWALVMENLNAWSSPVFKNTVIAEVIRKMGGWKRLCGMLESEVPFRKKDFIDCYLVSKRKDKEFYPILRGQNPDYKFIGYSPGVNEKTIFLEIQHKEACEKTSS